MPRTSRRQRIIDDLSRRYQIAKRAFVIENVIDDENDSVVDPPVVSYLNFMRAASRLLSANAARYISARIQRTFDSLTFERDLEVRSDSRRWLNDDSFLEKYRVTRD